MVVVVVGTSRYVVAVGIGEELRGDGQRLPRRQKAVGDDNFRRRIHLWLLN